MGRGSTCSTGRLEKCTVLPKPDKLVTDCQSIINRGKRFENATPPYTVTLKQLLKTHELDTNSQTHTLISNHGHNTTTQRMTVPTD